MTEHERYVLIAKPAAEAVQSDVECRFVELFDSIRPKIEFLARRARGEDPENLVAEVRARCWAIFPSRYEEELNALAKGEPSPHKWDGLFCRITRALVVDEYRGRQARYRALGHRLTREPFSAERSFGQIAPDKGAAACITELPVDCDYVVDDSSMSTEEIVEHSEIASLLRPALDSLPHDERVAIWAWAKRVPQQITARRLRCSRFGLMRLQRRALEGLREFYRSYGYECPVMSTTVRIRRGPGASR